MPGLTRVRVARFTAALCLAALAACGDGRNREENLFLTDRVLNIAHRGGNRIAPEATLEAFRSAVQVGADALEMDIHSSADGAIVVLHDDSVDRTTNGSGKVQELTLAELRALDAGYRYTRDGSTYPWRGRGLRVPTLEEVLDELQEQFLSIEIKQAAPSIVAPLVDLLTAKDMRHRVVIASFNDAPLHEIRALAPDILTIMSLGEMVAFGRLTDAEEADYTPPAKVLQAPRELGGVVFASPAIVARVRRFGLKLQYWTLVEAEPMRELVALGADALIVDDPELFAQIKRERGLP